MLLHHYLKLSNIVSPTLSNIVDSASSNFVVFHMWQSLGHLSRHFLRLSNVGFNNFGCWIGLAENLQCLFGELCANLKSMCCILRQALIAPYSRCCAISMLCYTVYSLSGSVEGINMSLWEPPFHLSPLTVLV